MQDTGAGEAAGWRTISVEGHGATMVVHHLPAAGQRWAMMLHDAGADHRSFRHQTAAFREGTDVLIPDLLGHGASTLRDWGAATLDGILADLERLIHTLGMQQLDILGHGLGAEVAQELAYRHPEVVERLVLISGQDHHRALDPADRARVSERRVVTRSMPWSWSVRVWAHTITTVPALREELYWALLATGRGVVMDLEHSTAQHRHPVEHYRVPVLVIRGQHHDPARLQAIHGGIAARSSRGRTAVIADAGYLCHLEQPERTNEVIRTFLTP